VGLSQGHADFPDQMIFRHKAPVPGILGSMKIVAYHPVIIHFEGIAVFFMPIDIDLATAHFQLIAFVGADATRMTKNSRFYKLFFTSGDLKYFFRPIFACTNPSPAGAGSSAKPAPWLAQSDISYLIFLPARQIKQTKQKRIIIPQANDVQLQEIFLNLCNGITGVAFNANGGQQFFYTSII
jgi:hypothetical protein